MNALGPSCLLSYRSSFVHLVGLHVAEQNHHEATASEVHHPTYRELENTPRYAS